MGGASRGWSSEILGAEIVWGADETKKYKKGAAILLLNLSNSDELANVTTEERRGVL